MGESREGAGSFSANGAVIKKGKIRGVSELWKQPDVSKATMLRGQGEGSGKGPEEKSCHQESCTLGGLLIKKLFGERDSIPAREYRGFSY